MPTSTARATAESGRPSFGRGFTLLEMAATLAVAVVAATLLVPRWSGRGPTALGPRAEELRRQCTTARWRALVEGRPVSVRLDRLPFAIHVEGERSAEPRLTFAPVPHAFPRTVVLRDASDAEARLTIPPGLAPLTLAVEGAP